MPALKRKLSHSRWPLSRKTCAELQDEFNDLCPSCCSAGYRSAVIAETANGNGATSYTLYVYRRVGRTVEENEVLLGTYGYLVSVHPDYRRALLFSAHRGCEARISGRSIRYGE